MTWPSARTTHATRSVHTAQTVDHEQIKPLTGPYIYVSNPESAVIMGLLAILYNTPANDDERVRTAQLLYHCL